MSYEQIARIAAQVAAAYDVRALPQREFRVPYTVWKQARRVLPRKHRHRFGGGRRPVDNRILLGNIIWRANFVNEGWRELNDDGKLGRIPAVPATTVHRHYMAWREKGVFEKLAALKINFVDRYYDFNWGALIARISEIDAEPEYEDEF